EDRVWNGLADADAGDLRHDIVEAIDVLNVERCVDIGSVAQQLLDVEATFGMPASRHISESKLIDQSKLGAPLQQRIQVHLAERAVLVFEMPARNELQTIK